MVFILYTDLLFFYQKTFPDLPQPGQMHLSAYNGLYFLNDSYLNCTFDRNIIIRSPNVSFANKIAFKDSAVKEIFIHTGKYTINNNNSCPDMNITFNDISLTGPPGQVSKAI